MFCQDFGLLLRAENWQMPGILCRRPSELFPRRMLCLLGWRAHSLAWSSWASRLGAFEPAAPENWFAPLSLPSSFYMASFLEAVSWGDRDGDSCEQKLGHDGFEGFALPGFVQPKGCARRE
jgi:hypothetical protein